MNMKTIEWNNGLHVGVQEINDAHKKMIEYYNELYTACFCGMGPAIVRRPDMAIFSRTSGEA